MSAETSSNPLDHGRTVYRVTLEFSDDYPPLDGRHAEGNPLLWDWASLIYQPDARCVEVVERPNPAWGSDEEVGK